jgi:hypothetical protein
LRSQWIFADVGRREHPDYTAGADGCRVLSSLIEPAGFGLFLARDVEIGIPIAYQVGVPAAAHDRRPRSNGFVNSIQGGTSWQRYQRQSGILS